MIDWLFGLFSPKVFGESNAIESASDMPPPIPRSPRTGKIDDYSDTWVFVSAWAESDLIKTREDNDSSARDALQTAALRGRIKLLKELLELPLPPKRDRPRQHRSTEEKDY